MTREVKFNDLRLQYLKLKKEIDRAVSVTLDSGIYILGDRVSEFESAFAKYCGTKYCVGVGSGTGALYLSLMALGIGKGDEVITVSNSAVATVVPIVLLGATPVFVDIDPTSFNIDTKKIKDRITSRTKAIVPVHLYGFPAQMDEVLDVAKSHGLKVIEDACQAHGTSYMGKAAGSFGALGAFSFYPTKNLGGYGDGGAIVTNSKSLYQRLKALRFYGSEDGANYKWVGFNCRLDEVQAAILLVKLGHLNTFNMERREIAKVYHKEIRACQVILPPTGDGSVPNHHLFVIKVRGRDALKSYLKSKGIDTLIHYPKPIHLQKAYAYLGYEKGALPQTEDVSRRILSLPIYPGLPVEHARYVADEVDKFYGK